MRAKVAHLIIPYRYVCLQGHDYEVWRVVNVPVKTETAKQKPHS